jgi:hypothetical protein
MSIQTKYGSATFNKGRGYRITSHKENNLGKMVHRLVWEEHYGEIPQGAYIIFKDGNHKNFDITNLELKIKTESLDTEYGKVWINDNGYVSVYNNGKLDKLHRVIWEQHYGKIPKGYQIHHIDGNKLNNHISNLKLISMSEHSRLHMIGENNPNYNNPLPITHKVNLSKSKNTTGYFRVSKEYSKEWKQGFRYRYSYYDKNKKRKEIKGVSLEKLKEKVLSKGLEWIEY